MVQRIVRYQLYYEDDQWIRTTTLGLLPYQAGNVNYGHCSIGTDTWRFASAYVDKIYSSYIYSSTGNLNGYPNQVYLGLSPGIMKLQNVHGSYIGFESNSVAGLYIYPGSNGTGTIGTSSLKWNQFYATNSSISTSDRREKKEISYIGQTSDYDTYMSDETLKSFILGLLSVIYKRVHGESGRPHHGFIAQDVEELMQRLGIKDHAAFIKSPKTETIEIEEEIKETYTDEMDGQTKTRTVTQTRIEQREIPGEYVYGLRYEEFIADIVRFVQLQDKKIEEQEEKINKQQEELDSQRAEINDLKARLERLEALAA